MMNFLSINSSFYSHLITIRPIHRYLITFTLLVFIIFIWLFFIHFPIQAQINCCNAKLSLIAKQLSLAKNAKIDCEAITKNIQDIKNSLKPYLYNARKLNENGSIPSTLQYARESGLTLTNCVAQSESDEQLYKKQTIFYEFKGTKNQILFFCDKINSCNKIIDCQEITIVNTGKNICHIKCSLQFFSVKPQ